MKILRRTLDINDAILRLVEDCVEERYPSGPIPFEEFIDRLCTDYLVAEGWDIESYGTPAVKKIMEHARGAQKELV